MRVLVVDQDSASNEAIVRSLREHYVVDAVTNKGDCLDLLRSNEFEVIVASERLEDGSGLELLGQISKKYPSVLRIFAADRHRLQLLKGRLGPFELFQTLAYPIDPERLLATLTLADAARDADADTSNIQHVVLSGRLESEEGEQSADSAEIDDTGESDTQPEPAPTATPGRSRGSAPASTRTAASVPTRAGTAAGAARAATATPGRSAPAAPAAAREPASDPASPAAPTARQRPRRAGNPSSPAPRPSSSGTRNGAGTSAPRPVSPATSRFPGSGTVGRPARPRVGSNSSNSSKVPPVRFPPLEPQPEPRPDAFAEAAALARAARDSRANADESDFKRTGVIVGTGAAVVLAVVFLGFKLFGSKSEPPKQAVAPPPAQAPAPAYPPEVTALVAQTEAAFSADDYKSARADVDKLRQLVPTHPRLQFFDGLLLQKANAVKTAGAGGSGHGSAGGRGSGKHGTHGSAAAADAASASGVESTSGGSNVGAAQVSGAGAAAAGGTSAAGATGTTSATGATTAANSDGPTGFAPETPPGFTRTTPANTASASSGTANTAAPSTTVPASTSATTSSATSNANAGTEASPTTAGTATVAPPTGAPAQTTSAAAASPSGAVTPPVPVKRASSSGEPPPVVREAKLIKRVNPDYPSAAKKEGIQGSVDLQITVTAQGTVAAATVISSNPPDVFDKAALAAVHKWKYDPRYVDGLASQADLKVHLDFSPGQ